MKYYVVISLLFLSACTGMAGVDGKQQVQERRLPVDNQNLVSDKDKAAMEEMKSWERDPEWKKDLPPSPIDQLSEGLDW